MLADLTAQSAGWSLAASDSESARFGLAVARLTIFGAQVDGVGAAISDADPDVVIARYPSALSGVASALAATGWPVINAGTLVYYEGRPASMIDWPGEARRRFAANVVVGMTPTLSAALVETFDSYPNHYAANPLLVGVPLAEVYAAWADRVAEDGKVITAALGGDVASLAVCAEVGREIEVVLAGTRPGFRGQGAYRALIRGVAEYADRAGIARVVISTQVQNVPVQRAWIAAGLLPLASFETAHLVRPGLLTAGRRPTGRRAAGAAVGARLPEHELLQQEAE